MTIPAPSWKPSNKEYHHFTPGVSSSHLKLFRQSPAAYHARYVAKTVEPERPSEAMVIGTIVNTLLLERELGDTGWVYRCDCAGRGAKEYKEAVANRPHQVVVTASEWETGEATARAILEPKSKAAEVARALLLESEGFSEYAFRWEEEISWVDDQGETHTCVIPCKLKADRPRMIGGRRTVVELKTSSNWIRNDFAAHVAKMGYDSQAAFYRRGLSRAFGEAPAFIWVAIHNSEPYEVACPVVMGPGFARSGDAQVEKDLLRLARCLEGDLPWEAETQEVPADLPVLEPPGWYARSLEE